MRVHIASFYMKGEALIWFKKAQRPDFETWEEFVEALKARFSEEWQHQREIEIQKILRMAERLKVLLDNFELNMSKKMEEIEPIPLQPFHEISETKEQSRNH